MNNFTTPFAGMTAAQLRRRAACFGGHHVTVPALLPRPPLQGGDSEVLIELQALLAEAKDFGGFSQKRSGATWDWERRMRACLGQSTVSSMLHCLQPLPAATAAAVVNKIAEVLRRPAGSAVPGSAMHVPSAVPGGLAECEYIAVMNLPVQRVMEAWESAVRGAEDAPAVAAAMTSPRELHVTLWHRNEVEGRERDAGAAQHEARGLAAFAAAAAGQEVTMEILGFDYSDDAVAARVRLRGAAGWLQSVPRPHATMWHTQRVPAKAAGLLQEREGKGEPGVVFLKLPEVPVVHGTVRVVPAVGVEP